MVSDIYYDPSSYRFKDFVNEQYLTFLGFHCVQTSTEEIARFIRPLNPNVAVFPNRGEGGTNQVAMECMASGIPVILSRNTGHLDIIEDGNCFTLDDQRVASFGFPGSDGVEGWGESQVDEIVARLEEVYGDRSDAARRARQGAETIEKRTWAAHARQLKEMIVSSVA